MMKFSFLSRIKKFAVNVRKKSKGITLGEFTRSYAEARHKEGEKMYEGRCGSILSMLKHLEESGISNIPLKRWMWKPSSSLSTTYVLPTTCIKT